MLTTFFADIKDFRRPQGRRYELDKILLLSVIAILCNAKSYRDISRFIKTVVQVHRSTDVFDTKAKQYINRQETAFYLSNDNLENAEICHRYVAQHWGIENKNHYVRDVSLQEDASRIRKNPYNLSVSRSTAMNILRKNKVLNIKGELYENSLHRTKVFSYPQVT